MSCLKAQSSQDPSKKQTSESAWKKQRPEELSGKDNLKFIKLSADSTVNSRFPAFLCSHNAQELWDCRCLLEIYGPKLELFSIFL